MLYIDPLPADRIQEIYPASYYSYAEPPRSWVYAAKRRLDRRFFRTILRQIPGESLRILDVGGGAGWDLLTVRASDPRVGQSVVVDLDPAAGEIAKKSGHDYVCTSIESFVPDAPFDLVLVLNLIEHVSAPVQVLAKLRSLLRPEGLVIIKTPNFDSLDARLFRDANWCGYHCPRHWVLFTGDSLAGAARRAGLEVRSATYTQGAPFWAASLLAWLKDRGVVRIDRSRPVVRHPLFGMLLALFASFDFVRRRFARTSQMVFVLGLAPHPGAGRAATRELEE